MGQHQKKLLLERPTAAKSFASILLALVGVCLIPIDGLAQEECAGLTYEGMCTGNLVQWCEEGEVIQIDCTDLGMICAWDDEKGYSCLGGDNMDICDLPAEGICASDTTVQWCSEEELQTLECKNGMVCGWNNDHMYYDCIPKDDYAAEPEGRVDEENDNVPNQEPSDEEADILPSNESDDEPVTGASGAQNGTEGSNQAKYADEEFNETPSSPADSPILGETGQQTNQKEDLGLPVTASDATQEEGCSHRKVDQTGALFILLLLSIALCRRRVVSSAD